MEVLADILEVVAWCFAVYVCAFDWEDVREAEVKRILTGKERKK